MRIELNSRALLAIFFRQKFKFAIVFTCILLMGIFLISIKERVYESRGSFVVKFGEGARPDVNSPDNKKPNEIAFNDRKEIMVSYIKIMQSNELLLGVIKAIGVEKIYPDIKFEDEKLRNAIEQEAVKMLSADLKIVSDDKSNVIEIFIRNKNAAVSAVVANKLMELFLQRQIQVYNTPQIGFLKQQIDEVRDQLNKSQKEFIDFKKSLEISDIDQELVQLLQQKRDISGMAFEAVTSAQTTLSALEAKAAEIRATYSENSSVFKKIDDGVREAKKQLETRKLELNAITSPDSPLAASIRKIDERVAFLEEQRGRFNELKQRVEMDEENYKYYQQRGEEARVNNVLNQENITRIAIVDNPVEPLKSVPMHRFLILITICMMGIFFGLCTVILFEFFDDRISTPEQLKSVSNLNVLAVFDKEIGIFKL